MTHPDVVVGQDQLTVYTDSHRRFVVRDLGDIPRDFLRESAE